MAKNELTFQQEWMKDARNLGCHAVRVADMYKIGTVDMWVKHPLFPGLWIENKYVKSIGRNMGISPMQRQFLKKELKAGGNAAWLCCVEREPSKRWELWVGVNPDSSYATDGVFVANRLRGERWSITEVINAMSALLYERKMNGN